MNITVLISVLVEKIAWNNQMQMYHGPPIGYNIRLAKGSELGQALAAIEEKMASNKPADTCRSRLQKDYSYFRIRDNQKKTTTM